MVCRAMAGVYKAGWRQISWYIGKYIPPDYQNAAHIGATLYPFFAFFLLLFPSYRKLPKEFIRDHRGELTTFFFVGVFLGLSGWAFFSATHGSALGGGTKFLLAILSIPAVLAMIALVLSSIVWIPAGLFLLPAWLFSVVSHPFKLGYFLVVKAPVMAWHYLHYLTVPHPAEWVLLKQQKMRMRRGVKVDPVTLGEELGGAMYNMEREGLPPWWKSENWRRRLKTLRAEKALRERLKAEKDIVDDETERLRERNRPQR